MLSCLLRCPLSALPLTCLSYTHLSILGLAALFFFFPGMSTSSILLTMCSSFILLTWPYHLSRFSVIFSDSCISLVVPIMCSFLILSLLVTPHIHLRSSSHSLLVVLLVLSLLPRSVVCTSVYLLQLVQV